MSKGQIKKFVDQLSETLPELRGEQAIREACQPFVDFLEGQGYQPNTLGPHLSRAGFYKMTRALPLIDGETAYQFEKKDGSTVLKHLAEKHIGLTPEQWAEANSGGHVVDRISEGGAFPLNPQKYLNRSGQLLKSNGWKELALGLIAVTGRRPHEILLRGVFRPVLSRYHVRFEGQGKKRGERVTFDIPVLFPAKYVVNRLRALRGDEELGALIANIVAETGDELEQNKLLDDRIGRQVRRIVPREFGSKKSDSPEDIIISVRAGDDETNAKALRAAYGALTTARDYKGSPAGAMLFFARVLGHIVEGEEGISGRDLSRIVTTLGYADLFVPPQFLPVPFPEVEPEPEPEPMTETEPEPEPEPMTEPKPAKLKPINARIDPADKPRFDRIRGKESQSKGFAMLLDFWEAKGGDTPATDPELVTRLQSRINQLEQKLAETRDELARREAELDHERQTRWELEQNQKHETKQQESETVEMTPSAIKELVIETIKELGLTSHAPQPERKPTPKPEPKPEREEPDWEGMTNAELWAYGKHGSAYPKVGRAFNAIATWNSEHATEDSQRIAPNNQALRSLAGVNGQVVSQWMTDHTQLVLDTYHKHGLENPRDPSSLTTYANKGKPVEGILSEIKIKVLGLSD